MSNGFVSGILAGAAVSVLGVGALSLMTPLPHETAMAPMPAPVETPAAPGLDTAAAPDPAPSAPDAAPVQVTEVPAAQELDLPAGSEFNKPKPEGEPILPGTDAARAEGGETLVLVPTPVEIDDGPMPDTAPAAEPEAVAETPDAMTAPAVDDSGAQVVAVVQEPVLPSPAAPGPQAPEAEAAPDQPAPAPQAEAAPTQAEAEDDKAAMAKAPETPTPSPAPADPAQDAEPAPVEPPAADEAFAPQVDIAGPRSLRVPVPGAEIATPNVTTGRLPSIGAETGTGTETGDAQAAPSMEQGALSRFAVPFTPEAGKPLFSVILIDVAEGGLDRSALTTFSFPVTFAVDAARPDAAEAMASYRAAGYEVILLTGGLPNGAKPQDLEVSLQSYMATVDQAVALMDAENGGMQANRALLSQLAEILSESGHGLVTYDKGLNTALQIAEAEGIPSTVIFRTLDEQGETISTIRRYLDRAAFKAAQDGQVVMLGHTYPETVTALFSWALEGKGADVSIAPISAVLTAQE